jgi:chorismate synthase (EC 4.2.3.5)
MGLRFLSAGESHGQVLISILEGLPSNLEVDIDFINNELRRRQGGYGRGGRMAIEQDKANILSGVRFGKTTGAPIAIEIKTKTGKTGKTKWLLLVKNQKILKILQGQDLDMLIW